MKMEILSDKQVKMKALYKGKADVSQISFRYLLDLDYISTPPWLMIDVQVPSSNQIPSSHQIEQYIQSLELHCSMIRMCLENKQPGPCILSKENSDTELDFTLRLLDQGKVIYQDLFVDAKAGQAMETLDEIKVNYVALESLIKNIQKNLAQYIDQNPKKKWDENSLLDLQSVFCDQIAEYQNLAGFFYEVKQSNIPSLIEYLEQVHGWISQVKPLENIYN